MEFKGQYLIPAPRERVWAALNDPEVLRQCIPGCEAMTKQSDTEYVATVATKLGPMRVHFVGKVTLSDLDPPSGYVITGEGQGGVAGFAKGSAKVVLGQEAGGTLLGYAAKGSVGGKMAQLGARLIDATAHKLAENFFTRFSALVVATPPQPGTATPAPPPATAPAAAKGVPMAVWVVGLIALVAAILALFVG